MQKGQPEFGWPFIQRLTRVNGRCFWNSLSSYAARGVTTAHDAHAT